MNLIKSTFFKYLLFISFAFTGFWSGYIMQKAMGKLTDVAGSSDMLDLQPNGNSESVYHYLDRVGKDGRNVLIGIYRFEDFIFPMAYGPFLFLAILYYFHKSFPKKKNLLWLSLIPILGVCFDYIENFTLIRIIELYPKQISTASAISGITLIKWIFAGLSGALLISSFTLFAIRKYLRKKI